MHPFKRIRQGLRGLRTVKPDGFEHVIASALSPSQQVAFRLLPSYDQYHLCAVYLALRAHRAGEELLLAALLHDLGKAALGGRVRLWDRTANVLLGAVWPAGLARLASLPPSRWRKGIALAVHHPHLGAAWATELGCSARVCWLIAHHGDSTDHGDAELALLMAIDDAV